MNLLHYLKKMTFTAILLYMLYGIGGIIIDIIFSPSPCGYGFGNALYQSRINYIRNNLKINIPKNGVEILKYKCDGFQDPFVEMSFIVSKKQAKTVIEDFKKTYSLALENANNTVYENTNNCDYTRNIQFLAEDFNPTHPLSTWDSMDISLRTHNNDACILNLRVGDM